MLQNNAAQLAASEKAQSKLKMELRDDRKSHDKTKVELEKMRKQMQTLKADLKSAEAAAREKVGDSLGPFQGGHCGR